eukprot:PITA_08819
MTSTSISSEGGNVDSSQQMEQQDQEEELVELPTTSGRTSREVRQTLRDTEEIVGAPRTKKRQHRQLDRYQALGAQVEEPSPFQGVVQHQVWVDAKATARHILRYVRRTIGYGLKYSRAEDVRLNGFIDADWVGSSVDRKKYLGVLLQCWFRDDIFVQQEAKISSSELTKAEYMIPNTATCEAIWLRKLLVSLFRKRMEATRVYCDNQSCIKLSENPVFHDRSKHIDNHCHFIRDYVQHEAIQLQCVPTGQ